MPQLESLLDFLKDMPHYNQINVCFERKSKFCEVEPQRSIKTHPETPKQEKECLSVQVSCSTSKEAPWNA